MPTIVENGELINISVEEFNRRVAQNRALFPTDEMGRPIGDNSTIIVDGVEYDMSWFFIDNEPFGGASQLLSVNTRTYIEEPTRSNDGSMPNIDDHDTFVVPRATFNFKYCNIRDYQRFTSRISMKNSFNLKYFDKDFGQWVEHNMYVQPQEAVKLYNIEKSAIGVLDYEVAFVGTLNNLQTFKVGFAFDFENGNPIFNDDMLLGWVRVNNIIQKEYNSNTIYEKGNIVDWSDGKRYQAIFLDTIIPKEKGINDTDEFNQRYWTNKVPTYWNNLNTWNSGDFVYYTNIENGEQKTKYYEALRFVQVGVTLTNKTYWKEISINKHDNTKSYNKGVYVYSGDTLNANNIYKATYENTKFKGQSPSESEYWAESSIGKDIEIEWGRSIMIPPPSEVFANKVIDGKTYSATRWVNAQGYAYNPNTSISIYVDTILAPKWE